jgi:hypothetical protein
MGKSLALISPLIRERGTLEPCAAFDERLENKRLLFGWLSGPDIVAEAEEKTLSIQEMEG